MTRSEIFEESKSRVRALRFGEPVTNICAAESNLRLHALFVEFITNSRKSRFGITHSDYWARCTDGNGQFWNTDITVIYPGHLSKDECEKLWAPVWESKFGNLASQ